MLQSNSKKVTEFEVGATICVNFQFLHALPTKTQPSSLENLDVYAPCAVFFTLPMRISVGLDVSLLSMRWFSVSRFFFSVTCGRWCTVCLMRWVNSAFISWFTPHGMVVVKQHVYMFLIYSHYRINHCNGFIQHSFCTKWAWYL